MEKNNKIICKNCGIEYGINQYYLSKIEGQKRMPICKHCFERELAKNESIEITFKKYNIPYITELFERIGDGHNGNYTFPRYMEALQLPQYINLKWKDTDWFKKEQKETNFYDNIVKNLKQEAEKLNNKLTTIRESTNSANSSQSTSNNMNLYIATLKSLRETLDLISKYDWRLMYSKYGTVDKNNNDIKQVSVWEQNHDHQIRNHKVWNVVENISTKIDFSDYEKHNSFKHD